MQVDVEEREHLLIMCSSFAGRTAVEAVRPQDGLIIWSYDLRQEMDAVIPGHSAVSIYPRTSGQRQNPNNPVRIGFQKHAHSS